MTDGEAESTSPALGPLVSGANLGVTAFGHEERTPCRRRSHLGAEASGLRPQGPHKALEPILTHHPLLGASSCLRARRHLLASTRARWCRGSTCTTIRPLAHLAHHVRRQPGPIFHSSSAAPSTGCAAIVHPFGDATALCLRCNGPVPMPQQPCGDATARV